MSLQTLYLTDVEKSGYFPNGVSLTNGGESLLKRLEEYLLCILIIALQGPSQGDKVFVLDQKALSVNQHRSGNCMNIRDFSLRQRISPSALLVSRFLTT